MIKIAIADDHSLFVEGVSSMLQNEENIEIVGTASNGKEALNLIHSNTVDVLLLDINMPELDGADAARKILQEYPDTRIIVVTMYDKTVMIQKLIEIGVHGYLLKNASKQEIVMAINAVAGGEEYFSAEVMKKIITRMRKEESKTIEITKREKQVLELVAEGLTTAEISEKLFISTNTVDSHRKNILSKTGCKNATQLINWARENELIL